MVRKTISVNDEIDKMIQTAAQMWPEVAHNQSMLIGKIIADWDRIRSEGGGRGQQINRRLDRHELMLILICQKLGIDYVSRETLEENHVP